MFIILLRYRTTLAEVDQFISEHREWLARQYAAGVFKLSGRMEPRTGGGIVATTDTKEQLVAILDQDPFQRMQLADYEIIEFLPTMTSPDLAHLAAN